MVALGHNEGGTMAGPNPRHPMPAARFAATFTLALLAALLVACGTTGDARQEEPAQAAPVEPDGPVSAAPAAAPAPVGPGGPDLVLAARFGQERALHNLLRQVDVNA